MESYPAGVPLLHVCHRVAVGATAARQARIGFRPPALSVGFPPEPRGKEAVEAGKRRRAEVEIPGRRAQCSFAREERLDALDLTRADGLQHDGFIFVQE